MICSTVVAVCISTLVCCIATIYLLRSFGPGLCYHAGHTAPGPSQVLDIAKGPGGSQVLEMVKGPRGVPQAARSMEQPHVATTQTQMTQSVSARVPKRLGAEIEPQQCLPRDEMLRYRMETASPQMNKAIRIGILSNGNAHLDLYALHRDRHRNKVCYTAHDTHTGVKYQVVHQSNICNIDRCCDEIVDGQMLLVRGFTGEFTAHIDSGSERMLWV